MHCERIQIDGASVIVCGSGPRKRFCRYCGARSVALCDWPKMRRQPTPIDQVKPGSMIYRFTSSTQPDEVIYLKPQPAKGEVWMATRRGNQTFEHVITEPWKPVLVAVQGTCDAPCCRRCLRHVGPDRDYCRRHWNAWSAIS
ncbi:MAG: hypothetical protein IT489_03205 [Gammaproteobacteria bacterium]|nr:hypothetical protein [Gammaproteobacteria bacterium]